jgi:hypothetical protein
MRSPIAAALVLVLAVGPAACGGGDSDGGADESATPTAAATGATKTGLAPDELVGTWVTTLEESDIAADASPELKDGGLSWTIRIGNTGGPDDGPYLAIDSDEFGNLEAPSLRVNDDRLLLLKEECAVTGGEAADPTYEFYDNEYRWTLSGGTLEISTITNQCPDRVAETVLTSRPWTKTG